MGRLLYNYLLSGISLVGVGLSIYMIKEHFLDYAASKKIGNGRFFIAKESLRKTIFKGLVFLLLFSGSWVTVQEHCPIFLSLYFHVLFISAIILLDSFFDVAARSYLNRKFILPHLKKTQ